MENLIPRLSAEDHPLWLQPRFFSTKFVWDTPALRNLSPGDLNMYHPFSSVYLGQIIQWFACNWYDYVSEQPCKYVNVYTHMEVKDI